MKHYISKQAKKCVCMCMQMHCGALQGMAGNGQVHFLAPRGCLTSAVRAARPLHHLCSRMSVPPPPADKPTKENEEWWSFHDADLTPAPLQRLQAVASLCCWTFLPLTHNFCPPTGEKKSTEAVKPTRGGGSLCASSLSNSLPHVFYLTDALVLVDSRYWKCHVRLCS